MKGKTNKIERVADILERAASSGKIPRALKTPDNCYYVGECVKRLSAGQSASCIQSEVKDFFQKNGFTVTEEGIGWRIWA